MIESETLLLSLISEGTFFKIYGGVNKKICLIGYILLLFNGMIISHATSHKSFRPTCIHVL